MDGSQEYRVVSRNVFLWVGGGGEDGKGEVHPMQGPRAPPSQENVSVRLSKHF